MIKNHRQQIITYLRNGQIVYLIFFLLLNGFDTESLQLARIGAQNKLKKRLKRKYSYVLDRVIDKPKALIDINESPIWFCWLQGLDSFPAIVRLCYNSLKKKTKRPIILITEENYKSYTDFPEYIIEKYNKGIISKTHFSDLLRIELLGRNGGTWIDSTVLLTDNIPSEIENCELSFFQKCKPGRDGNGIYTSSWFLNANSGNPIILLTRELLFEYWKRNNFLTDYFLFHIFFCIACDSRFEDYLNVPKQESSSPHLLLLSYSRKYKKDEFDYNISSSWIHKLSYKVDNDVVADKNNVYNYLLNTSI